MNRIIKTGIGFLIFGGLSFLIAVFLFAFRGNVKSWMVKLGEISIVLWIVLVLIGLFLIIAGTFIDED